MPDLSDIRAVQAREFHAEIDRNRKRRNQLIVQLAAEGWTLRQLGGAIGCSHQLIAWIIQRRSGEPGRR